MMKTIKEILSRLDNIDKNVDEINTKVYKIILSVSKQSDYIDINHYLL